MLLPRGLDKVGIVDAAAKSDPPGTILFEPPKV